MSSLLMVLLACNAPEVEDSQPAADDTGRTGTHDSDPPDTSDPPPDTGESGEAEDSDPLDTGESKDASDSGDTGGWGTGGSGGSTGTGDSAVGGCSYAYHVPECALDAAPMAVVYSQHGSGGRGYMMVQQWQPTADDHCFMVIGQDSETQSSWNTSGDVTCFSTIAEEVEALYDIDTRRRYLNGHSAGGHWTWVIGLYNSDWFGGLAPTSSTMYYAKDWGIWPDQVGRPIPVHISHGTADTVVPYSYAESAYETLSAAGWPVELYTIKGGDHFSLPGAEEEAWNFLEANHPDQ